MMSVPKQKYPEQEEQEEEEEEEAVKVPLPSACKVKLERNTLLQSSFKKMVVVRELKNVDSNHQLQSDLLKKLVKLIKVKNR